MTTLRTSKRRQMPLAGAALAGLVYVGAWIVGLAFWPSNVAITGFDAGSTSRPQRSRQPQDAP